MKKLLLSMAVLALAGTASAETVTLDFANNDYGLTRTSDTGGAYIDSGTALEETGVAKVVLTKTSGKNGWRLWSNGLRVYKSSDAAMTISIDGAQISKVDFECETSLGGTLVVGQETINVNTANFSWEGDVTEWKGVFTPKANKSIKKLTVTYEMVSGDLLSANLAFPQAEYSADLEKTFEAPVLTKDTDAAATYTSSNPEVATVDAATGVVTLVAAGTTTITATTPETGKYRAGSASYTLNVLSSVKSLADFFALGENATAEVGFPLTVTYQNGINTYATDGENAILIYGTAPTYVAGDVIPAGWSGQYVLFNTLPEIKPTTALAEAAEHVDYTIPEVDNVTAEDVNRVVTIKNVTFDDATPMEKSKNFTGNVGVNSIAFRTNWAMSESAEAGVEYHVTGAVALFKGAVQVYPISYVLSSTVGIDSIEATEAAAEYYNLQGVRVANPEHGIFVRVQNGKAVKVVK